MSRSRWFKPFLPLVLTANLMVTACSSAPSKYDEVQNDTTGFKAPAAVEKGAEPGGTFNPFFPASEGEFKVVPSQEKKGFAEYKLKRDGETLAMLTINDTISLPAAAKKYADATDSLAGFPMVKQGTTTTGILVNGRYQVKVLSRSEAFTAADRTTWLEKFDLDGLTELKADTKAFRRVQKKQATQAPKAAPTKSSNQESAVFAQPTVVSEPTAIVEPISAPEQSTITEMNVATEQTTTSETAAVTEPRAVPERRNVVEPSPSVSPETMAPKTESNSTLETSPFLVPTPAS